MILLAIDPGKAGGIAWRKPDEKACCVPMPATEGDLIARLNDIMPWTNVDTQITVYLENIVKHMGAGIPASTMAVYASNWGFIKGAVMMSRWPLYLITPQKWQKELGLAKVKGVKADSKATKSSNKRDWKNKLKSEAQRLYPHLDVSLGTADALLILAYAERQIR